MDTVDELRQNWEKNPGVEKTSTYSAETLAKVFKARVKKQVNTAMQYFWASFALQIIVYSLLSHVIVKYWTDQQTIILGIGGIFLFLPFTIVLMKKFKKMATINPGNGNGNEAEGPLQLYVSRHHALLQSFFRFKKIYELLLIPLSSALGIFLTFKLYVPGGIFEHPGTAAVLFVITIGSCIAAIRNENKKHFETPLHHLEEILEEFKVEGWVG
jgi:hypothetical protein